MLPSAPKSFFPFVFLLLAFTQVEICNGAVLGHSFIASVGDPAKTTHGARSFDNMFSVGALDRREPKGLKFVEKLLTTFLRRHYSSTEEGALDKREQAVDFDRREPLRLKLIGFD